MSVALNEQLQLSGFQVAKRTGIGAGRIYLVLARMEIAGRIESYWVDGPMRDRTRLYRLAAPPPTIVCLCGSTRFGDAFREANLRETLAGRIVLSIGCDMRTDAELFADLDQAAIERIKDELDELHKRKIDLADEILVLNVGGYIGDSTRSEVAYAAEHGKPIRWLEPHNIPADAIDLAIGGQP